MSIYRKFKEGLSKNVLFLGIVSGLTDISSEMLYPVIPVFLTAILKANMEVVGLIEGIAEATASIFKIWGGYLSDKYRKRKPFVVCGYSLSAISKPLMALASSWYFVLFVRFMDRLGKGIRTSPRDALIAASSDNKHWGKAFGFHRAFDTLGAAIGPLAALLLFHFLGESESSYRYIFLIAFIPAVLSIFILRYVKDITLAENVKTQNNVSKKVPLSKEFKIFTVLYFIFAIGNSSDAFLILKTKSLGFSMTEVMLVYFTYNIIYAIISTPAGMIADRIGKIKTFIIGLFIFSAVYFGFGINHSRSVVWLLFALYAFYAALNEGIYKAVISHLTTDENRGAAMGVFQGISGIAVFVASFLAGILWNRVSDTAPFIFGSATAFISAVLIFVWSKWKRIEV
ncbi:MAG: MFS transporter [Elusimicrobiales bacterium]|nr:MFS transporter [Elusimicrobiales bacterium]